MTKSFGFVTALVLGSTTLVGCGIASHSAAPAPASQSPSVAGTGKTSSPSSETTHSSTSTSTGPTTVSHSSGGNSGALALVREWAQAALKGQAVGIPYGDQKSYDSLAKLWGLRAGNGVNGITYVTYSAHNAVVGFNEGNQLADVRSYNPNLHQITLADIESVMGQPQSVSHSTGSVIYTYDRGSYRLLWVFSKSASGQVSATVNHVDVQWPQGMVAPMGTNPLGNGTSNAQDIALISQKGYGVTSTTPNASVKTASGAMLTSWIGTAKKSQDGYNHYVFFFLNGKYLGTDTTQPSLEITRTQPAGIGSIAVTYPVYQKNNSFADPTGVPVTITYHWNGTHLLPNKPYPQQFR